MGVQPLPVLSSIFSPLGLEPHPDSSLAWKRQTPLHSIVDKEGLLWKFAWGHKYATDEKI